MSSSLRVRKNVSSLTQNEKNKFVNAVLILKKTPSKFYPSDRSKNRYDDYVEIHHHSMMAGSDTDPRTDPNWYPGWAHLGPAFFSWHRQYLLEFENDLQVASEDNSITIPYWDWTNESSFPFTKDFLGSDGEDSGSEAAGKVIDGPFAYDGPNKWTINFKDDPSDPPYLERGFGRINNAKKLPISQEVQISMFITNFDSPPWKFVSRGFRRIIEINFHNLVHRWVNGTMVTMASPNDPVFWLHHANIDRLWAEWQRNNPEVGWYLPARGAPLGHNLYDTMIFDHMDRNLGFTPLKPADVINTMKLNYTYESEMEAVAIEIQEKPAIKFDLTKRPFLQPFPLENELK
jgi:tyrosinase